MTSVSTILPKLPLFIKAKLCLYYNYYLHFYARLSQEISNRMNAILVYLKIVQGPEGPRCNPDFMNKIEANDLILPNLRTPLSILKLRVLYPL